MGAAGRFDYRPDIDGLRAVAIITVVGNHVGLPGWSGGYVGVDVFFVISGFLITSMLVTEAVQYRRIDLWAFYARRVRRLLPAFLTVLLGTLLLGAIYLGSTDGEQQGLVKSATAAVLLNANHYFWHATGGYFDRPAELQPLLHLWSLSVEEQYYLVWPLALIGLLHWKPRFDYRRKVVVTLSFIALVSFLFSLWCLSRTQSAAFYLMPARAWELAMGAVIALVPLRAQSSCSPIGIVLGYSGLAAITLAVTVYDQTTPGGALLLPVLGTIALIAGNKLAPNGLPARILSSKAMVGIGLISYSWYLWHWPLLAITRSVQLGGRDLLRDFLLAGIAALVLACATYRWIEKPMRGNTRLRSLGPRANVSLGALASASCILLAASLGAWAKYDSTSSLEMKLTAAKRDRPPLHEICHNHLNQEARLPRPDQCVVSGGSKNVDAVLWGDSYAAFWMPALTEISEKDRISTYQLTRDKCPPLLEFNITRSSDPTQPRKCLEFQRMAFDEIRRLRTERGLRSVILAANWVAYSGDRMEETLGPTLDLLGGLGLRVLIIGPSPNLPYKAPECLLRHDERFCAVKKVDFYNQRARALDAIERAINGRTDVRVLDPTSFFCDDKICPAIRDGVVIYIDTGHVTATASRNFADFAGAELGWLR
jgi:peptidoglycan/LPS O-acetylase OafA/YrhL